MSVIHTGENYQVLRFHPNLLSNVAVVFFEHWRPHFSAVDPSSFDQIPEKNLLTTFNLNCYIVQTKRNDWFQSEGIEAALAAILNKKEKHEIHLGYGNSMGGYAAIAFNDLYGGDYFLTTSPQASLSPAYAETIGETRWKDAWPLFRFDKIIEGSCSDALGAVLVDGIMPTDKRHCADILKGTRSIRIDCPGTWHHSGKIVQREWGLSRFVADLAKELDAGEDATLLLSKLQAKMNSSLAGRFMNAEGPERLRITEEHGVETLCATVDAFCLQQAFEDRPTPENALAITRVFQGTMPDIGKQNWVKKSFSKALSVAGFSNFAEDMVSDVSTIGTDLRI